MQRGKKLILLAHCLLNPNAKVNGLAATSGALPLIKELTDSGYGIIQLPCPEHSYLGGKRWGMSFEQYNNSGYRAHCRKLLEPVADELADYLAEGYRLDCVLGMDGSPSCGVAQTCFGYAGGEIGVLAAPPDTATNTSPDAAANSSPDAAANSSPDSSPGEAQTFVPTCELRPGSGVFMAILKQLLQERQIRIPFIGLDEQNPAQSSLSSLLKAAQI